MLEVCAHSHCVLCNYLFPADTGNSTNAYFNSSEKRFRFYATIIIFARISYRLAFSVQVFLMAVKVRFILHIAPSVLWCSMLRRDCISRIRRMHEQQLMFVWGIVADFYVSNILYARFAHTETHSNHTSTVIITGLIEPHLPIFG